MDFSGELLVTFADPAVRDWCHRVIEAARAGGHDFAVDEDKLRGAIDDPDIFHSDQGAPLWWDFWQAYGAALVGSKDLDVRSQPFASQFRIFSQDPRILLSHEFRRKLDGAIPPVPSEFELVRRYRAVRGSAEELRCEIEGLCRTVVSPGLKDMMDRFASELEEMESESRGGIAGDRQRLFEIDSSVGRAAAIMDMDRRALAGRAPELFRNTMFAIDLASERAKARLNELRSRIAAELALNPLDEEPCAAAGDKGLFEAAAELSLRLSEILRIGLFTGKIGAIASEKPDFGGRMSFEELSDLAFHAMAAMVPKEALRSIDRTGANPLLVDAALLDAAFRHRMGDSSQAYAEEIGPFIRRVLVGRPQRVRDGTAAPDGEAEAERDDIAAGRIGEWLFEQHDSGEPRPMHLELGGGSNPAGLALAARLADVTVLSIDPNCPPIAEEAISRIGFVPRNFLALAGRAERLVPYSFKRPLFEGALMVAPPPLGWVGMMLSAILAVKPGGRVDIYKFNSRNFDFGFLRRSGFEVSVEDLDGADPSLPPSSFFESGVSVNHIGITVPERGGGDDGWGEGEGPGPIVRGRPGTPRPLTRKRRIGPPRGPASASDISAGVFAAPLNAPVAAPCAAQSLSLFTGFLVRAI
ncbi:MAG: hypothetical protein JXA24_05550 [Proteobacteria bacterium]|nr:hypothetical protein [Pseudomonadota bacterium]